MDNAKFAKELAKHLAQTLQASGQSLPNSVLLEVVAKATGERNWHAFLAAGKQKQKPAGSPVDAVVPVTAPWSPAHGPMSEAQYVRGYGMKCPVCGSTSGVQGDDVEIDAGSASQESSCSDCNSSWCDRYLLDGYDNLKVGDTSVNAGLMYALQNWLYGKRGALSEDQQEDLDELVVDVSCQRGMDEVNHSSSTQLQLSAIGSAEQRASEGNNEGVCGQLSFLYQDFSTPEAFAQFLAEKLGAPLDKLVL